MISRHHDGLEATGRLGILARLGFGPSMSLRKRIGILAAFAAGVSVLLISIGAYWTVRVSLTRQVDSALTANARSLVGTRYSDPNWLVHQTLSPSSDTRVMVLVVSGDQWSVVAPQNSPALPNLDSGSKPELKVALGGLDRSVRTVDGYPKDRTNYRVVALPRGKGIALILAQPLTQNDRLVARLGLLMAGLSAVGIAIAAWAGFAVARSGLRPIQDLTSGTEHVARTGELMPIAVRGDDELARLARSFNTMLAALGAARERERRLIADAGHELRTPLTSMRTNIDLLAQNDASLDGHQLAPDDRRALIADVRAQIEELTLLIGDLVELSRDTPAEQIGALDLADVCERALERVRRRAPGLRFAVETTPWPMVGDPQSLERAVTNLLDNAVKWSPAGATIVVSLHEGVLSVADQGVGIADADLPHVFDRFYRSEEARAKPGSGLGLSIVAQSMARHGGSVTAGRAPGGGAEFVLRLPGLPPSVSAVLTDDSGSSQTTGSG